MAKFKEVVRIKVNDSRDIVLSQVIEGALIKGINIGSYVRTEKYTGYTKGGTMIPVDKLDELTEKLKFIMDAEPVGITVVCPECGERFYESEVKFLNIEEDFRGRDEVTFRCPKCGKDVKSLRYG